MWLTASVSNQAEALISLTNRNTGEEGLTCRRHPIVTHLRVTHPPISCFCFAVWILEVNNIITTVSTDWSEKRSRRRCYRLSFILISFGTVRSVCVMCAIWASPPGHSSPRRVWAWRLESGSRGGEAGSGGDRPEPKASDLGQREGREFGGSDGVPGRTGRPRSAPRLHLRLVQPGHHVSDLRAGPFRELNLLDTPDCCIIVFSDIYILVYFLSLTNSAKQSVCVCVCASRMKLQASVCLIKTSRCDQLKVK